MQHAAQLCRLDSPNLDDHLANREAQLAQARHMHTPVPRNRHNGQAPRCAQRRCGSLQVTTHTYSHMCRAPHVHSSARFTSNSANRPSRTTIGATLPRRSSPCRRTAPLASRGLTLTARQLTTSPESLPSTVSRWTPRCTLSALSRRYPGTHTAHDAVCMCVLLIYSSRASHSHRRGSSISIARCTSSPPTSSTLPR